MAEYVNFEVLSNTAPTIRFTLVLPEDVTGWNTLFTFKRKMADANAIFTANGVISNANVGIFDVTLTAAQTGNLASGNYAYSFRRTDPGAEDVLSYGAITIKQIA